MKVNKVERYNISIVLIGNFNPAIITPHWLLLKDLIRESDITESPQDIIHPEVSKFNLEFAKIQVTKDRFQVDCSNEAEFPVALDLVISVFRYLGETPVSAIGLNHTMHVNLKSAKSYRSFGNWLAPLDNWDEDLERPGLLELKMQENHIEDLGIKNFIIISPSALISPFGITIQLNYHINVKPQQSISELIEVNWKKSELKAEKLVVNIFNKFQNAGNTF